MVIWMYFFSSSRNSGTNHHLRGNPKPSVSFPWPDRNQWVVCKLARYYYFRVRSGWELKFLVWSGLGYFLPGNQTFLSKNFGDKLGIWLKWCLAFPNLESLIVSLIITLHEVTVSFQSLVLCLKLVSFWGWFSPVRQSISGSVWGRGHKIYYFSVQFGQKIMGH